MDRQDEQNPQNGQDEQDLQNVKTGKTDIRRLTEMVIGAAFKVHNLLRAGFLEKVYENALLMELLELGLRARQQVAIPVYYRNRVVGGYFADLLVEDCLVVEVKAVQSLAVEHEVQLVHYLTATRIEDGLLLNFGPSVQMKHKYLTYRSSGPRRQ